MKIYYLVLVDGIEGNFGYFSVLGPESRNISQRKLGTLEKGRL